MFCLPLPIARFNTVGSRQHCIYGQILRLGFRAPQRQQNPIPVLDFIAESVSLPKGTEPGVYNLHPTDNGVRLPLFVNSSVCVLCVHTRDVQNGPTARPGPQKPGPQKPGPRHHEPWAGPRSSEEWAGPARLRNSSHRQNTEKLQKPTLSDVLVLVRKTIA